MKILFSSYLFHPSVGGIESVSKILAEKFAEAGHEVHLITQTRGEQTETGSYRITRRPSLIELTRLLRWCDLLFQNNISLRNLVPALVLRKRVLVAHHTWIQDVRGQIRLRDRIKYALLPFVTNVAISQAVADRLNVPAVVVGNPYDDKLFRVVPGIARDKTIAFVGRLVSDKGVDVLLRAQTPAPRRIEARPDNCWKRSRRTEPAPSGSRTWTGWTGEFRRLPIRPSAGPTTKSTSYYGHPIALGRAIRPRGAGRNRVRLCHCRFGARGPQRGDRSLRADFRQRRRTRFG